MFKLRIKIKIKRMGWKMFKLRIKIKIKRRGRKNSASI